MVTAQEGRGAVPDYLVHYTTENIFRFTELINDDYFKAIRTLLNAELYVSSAKLLMSCVDTLSFVEYSNVSGNFTKWLDAFVDLAPLGITSGELWEFRNSVLHMSNLYQSTLSLNFRGIPKFEEFDFDGSRRLISREGFIGWVKH